VLQRTCECFSPLRPKVVVAQIEVDESSIQSKCMSERCNPFITNTTAAQIKSIKLAV